MAEKAYILRMNEAEHKTIKRRAATAGISMKRYIIDMTLDGKINKKPK